MAHTDHQDLIPEDVAEMWAAVLDMATTEHTRELLKALVITMGEAIAHSIEKHEARHHGAQS